MQSESVFGAGVERLRSNGRRVFAPTHRRFVVEQCLQPGASVAGVAMSHGINANLVRKWIGKYKDEGQAAAPMLLPVTIASAQPAAREQPRPSLRHPSEPVPPCVIEVEVHDARIRLFGRIEADQLRSLFDALAPR